MERTISISQSLFEQLDREAKRSNLSPSELAERLLAERLSTDEQTWRNQFARLMSRVHAHMRQPDPAEIENDITAASTSAKAARRAHRHPD